MRKRLKMKSKLLLVSYTFSDSLKVLYEILSLYHILTEICQMKDHVVFPTCEIMSVECFHFGGLWTLNFGVIDGLCQVLCEGEARKIFCLL